MRFDEKCRIYGLLSLLFDCEIVLLPDILCFFSKKMPVFRRKQAFFIKFIRFGNVSITILLRNYLPNHLFSSFEDKSYPNPSIKLE